MRVPRVPQAAPEVKPSPDKAVAIKGQAKSNRTPEREVALGARIRAARISARMSQTALGDAVGVSFQQIQKYELGRDRMAASTLQGIAAALGVHPGSFFDETSVPIGSLPELRAAMSAAETFRQIGDPHVRKQLLALARALANGAPSEPSGDDGDEAR